MITSFRSIRRLRERCVDAMTATSDENGMGARDGTGGFWSPGFESDALRTVEKSDRSGI